MKKMIVIAILLALSGPAQATDQGYGTGFTMQHYWKQPAEFRLAFFLGVLHTTYLVPNVRGLKLYGCIKRGKAEQIQEAFEFWAKHAKPQADETRAAAAYWDFFGELCGRS